MKNILSLILVSCLAACTTPTIIEKPANIPISPALLAKCPPLPSISNGKTTVDLGELMTYTTNVNQQYINCATKDDALIDEVNKPVGTPTK